MRTKGLGTCVNEDEVLNEDEVFPNEMGTFVMRTKGYRLVVIGHMRCTLYMRTKGMGTFLIRTKGFMYITTGGNRTKCTS